jgi:hypothetical protein
LLRERDFLSTNNSLAIKTYQLEITKDSRICNLQNY